MIPRTRHGKPTTIVPTSSLPARHRIQVRSACIDTKLGHVGPSRQDIERQARHRCHPPSPTEPLLTIYSSLERTSFFPGVDRIPANWLPSRRCSSQELLEDILEAIIIVAVVKSGERLVPGRPCALFSAASDCWRHLTFVTHSTQRRIARVLVTMLSLGLRPTHDLFGCQAHRFRAFLLRFRVAPRGRRRSFPLLYHRQGHRRSQQQHHRH